MRKRSLDEIKASRENYFRYKEYGVVGGFFDEITTEIEKFSISDKESLILELLNNYANGKKSFDVKIKLSHQLDITKIIDRIDMDMSKIGEEMYFTESTGKTENKVEFLSAVFSHIFDGLIQVDPSDVISDKDVPLGEIYYMFNLLNIKMDTEKDLYIFNFRPKD